MSQVMLQHWQGIDENLHLLEMQHEECMVLGHCEACLKSCYNAGKE